MAFSFTWALLHLWPGVLTVMPKGMMRPQFRLWNNLCLYFSTCDPWRNYFGLVEYFGDRCLSLPDSIFPSSLTEVVMTNICAPHKAFTKNAFRQRQGCNYGKRMIVAVNPFWTCPSLQSQKWRIENNWSEYLKKAHARGEDISWPGLRVQRAYESLSLH